jgi:hypothetical protein
MTNHDPLERRVRSIALKYGFGIRRKNGSIVLTELRPKRREVGSYATIEEVERAIHICRYWRARRFFERVLKEIPPEALNLTAGEMRQYLANLDLGARVEEPTP